MGRARVLKEIRLMRFEELPNRDERGHLTQAEAAEMLGMSERTFRRWQGRWRAEGAAGLRDRRVGKPSSKPAAADIAAMLGLYREHYDGFTVKHFQELAETRHGYKLGYLPAHNARFAVSAELEGSAYVPVAPEQWREVLCRQESRQVGNDNCVSWRGRPLQIPPSRLRPHFVRAKVRLHEYVDGAVDALFWGPHRIADFPPPGTESDRTRRAA